MKTRTKFLIIAFITVLAISFFSLTSHALATDLPEAQDGVITLTDDVTLEKDVTGVIVIPADKTITLDLNGHTITAESGNVAITNNGTLTIKGDGNVIANGNYAVLNHGQLLTINGGNYSKTTPSSTQSLISNGWYTAADNASGEKSNMIINGGSFDGGTYTTIKNDSYGVMTINGGTFTSTHAAAGIQEAGSKLTINGGTFDTVVLVQNYSSVEGEIKEEYINGGNFNKVVNFTAKNEKNTVQASDIKVYIGNNPVFNSSISITNNSAKAGTVPFSVEQFNIKNIGGSLTFSGKDVNNKLPTINLDGLTVGGSITLSYVEASTISNTVVNGSEIKAGDVTLTNVTVKKFANNAKNATIVIKEGTNINQIAATYNTGNSIIVDGGTIDTINGSGTSKMAGFENITINNGSVSSIETSKGNIVVNGGKVDSIKIIDKFVTSNPVSVKVKEGATVGTIDNQRANDENATVETTIIIPENNVIGENGKVLTKISASTISNIAKTYSYTGKDIEVIPTVKVGDKTLVKDTDYTLSYENNVKVGIGELIVTGIGDYTGTISKEFIIVPKATVISVKSQTKTSINLSWEKSDGASGYKLYMATSKKGNYKKIATINSKSYNKKDLKVGTVYYFKVRPYTTIDGNEKHGEYSEVFEAATVPNKTTLKSLTTGVEKVTLKWTKVSGANGYVIYMATSKKGKYSKVATVNGRKTVKYTKKGLMPNRKHYFKVKAIIKTDDSTAYSSFSNKKSVRTKNLYIIKKGDTLTALSKKFKTTIKKLVKLNNIKNKNLIRVGRKLKTA